MNRPAPLRVAASAAGTAPSAARLIAAAASLVGADAAVGRVDGMHGSSLLLSGADGLSLVHALLDARGAAESPSARTVLGHDAQRHRPLRALAIIPPAGLDGWPALRARLAALGAPADSGRWPEVLLPGLDPLPVLPDGLALTLAVGEAGMVLRRLAAAFDGLLFGDTGALATDTPGRWQIGVLARLATAGATLWIDQPACDAAFDAALRRAGFQLDHRAPSPSSVGCASPAPAPLTANRVHHRVRPSDRGSDPPPIDGRAAVRRTDRRALVIGAGLAGSAVAAALAHRGWAVTVVDRHAGPAREGSGQPLVVDHLHLSPDDNPMARLTRAGARLAAVRAWVGGRARPLGKLIVPADVADRDAQRAMLARLAWPSAWARMVDADTALALTGLRAPLGGLWLAKARVADPVAQCADWLATPGITVLGGATVETLTHRDGTWWALGRHSPCQDDTPPPGAAPGADPGPAVLAVAPVAVVAAATASPSLADTPSIVLERLAGQTTMLAGGPLASLHGALGGAAYACPAGDGRVLVGSTFSDADDFAPDAAGDADNVARIATALGLAPDAVARAVLSRHGGVRCATRDRLPAIGAMPDESAIGARAAALSSNDRLPLTRRAGLYGAFGMGARGLLWSVLGAEVIAAHLDGESPPLERDLLDAIDPARFARSALRHGRWPA